MTNLGSLPRSVLVECPHGDTTCPCPDGDSCHYDGPDAMACCLLGLAENDGQRISFWPDGRRFPAGGPHCHVEGCEWAGGFEPGASVDTPSGVLGGDVEPVGCGLRRLGADFTDRPLGSPQWTCGAARRIDAVAAFLYR